MRSGICGKISAIYGNVNTIVRTIVSLGDPLVKSCPHALPYIKYRACVIISLNPPKRKLTLRGGRCFPKVLSLESSQVNLWIQGQPSEQSPGNHVATRMDLILHSHLGGEFSRSDSGSQLLSVPRQPDEAGVEVQSLGTSQPLLRRLLSHGQEVHGSGRAGSMEQVSCPHCYRACVLCVPEPAVCCQMPLSFSEAHTCAHSGIVAHSCMCPIVHEALAHGPESLVCL